MPLKILFSPQIQIREETIIFSTYKSKMYIWLYWHLLKPLVSRLCFLGRQYCSDSYMHACISKGIAKEKDKGLTAFTSIQGSWKIRRGPHKCHTDILKDQQLTLRATLKDVSRPETRLNHFQTLRVLPELSSLKFYFSVLLSTKLF